MDLAENFRYRGRFDAADLRARLQGTDESMWLDSVAKIASVHRASRGIFLKNDLKTEHLYGTVHPPHATYLPIVAPMLDALRDEVGGGYVIRLQFSRHLPGHGFDPHVDTFSFTLTRSHRIHIAIETNDQVWFSVGGERKHLAEGFAWEINNVRVHAGHNAGSSPRIHMIVDIAKPLASAGERIAYALNRLTTGSPGALLVFRPRLDGEPAPSGHVQPTGSPPPAAGRVAGDLVVGVNYRVVSRTGDVLFADDSAEPLQYLHGRAQLPPAVEAALDGLRVGDAFSVDVPAEVGFGVHDPDLVAETQSSAVRGVYAVDGELPFASFARKPGIVDANHPLAGLDLRIDGMVHHIRSLDADEHVHAIYEGPTLPTGHEVARVVHAFAQDPHAFEWIDARGFRHK